MTNLRLPPCRQLLKDNADGNLGIKITAITHECYGCKKIFSCEEICHIHIDDMGGLANKYIEGRCNECWDDMTSDLRNE